MRVVTVFQVKVVSLLGVLKLMLKNLRLVYCFLEFLKKHTVSRDSDIAIHLIVWS